MHTSADVLDKVASILVHAGVADATGTARTIFDAASDAGDAATVEQRALAMADACASGTPVGYVVGRVRFMGVSLLAAPGALVPRAETELLGETALALLLEPGGTEAPRLIDMCCGAGNLVCGIAVHAPSLRAWASDLTEEAVALARANVEQLKLSHRVEVLRSDLFAELGGYGLEGTIDIVVCNPPYISTGKLAQDGAGLLVHEPRAAFDGGPYGVSIFQRVIRDAVPFLRHGGTLLFEIGVGQERQVQALFGRNTAYEAPTAVMNHAGQPRVLAARKR